MEIDHEHFKMIDKSYIPDKIDMIIPELEEGTQVYINNKEHNFHLERGVIIERAHKQYRLKFKSANLEINDKCLWVPDHWVDPIPKDEL